MLAAKGVAKRLNRWGSLQSFRTLLTKPRLSPGNHDPYVVDVISQTPMFVRAWAKPGAHAPGSRKGKGGLLEALLRTGEDPAADVVAEAVHRGGDGRAQVGVARREAGF